MKYLMLILILFTNFIQAQCNINSVQSCELVNNGDFENYFLVPNSPSQIDRACGWNNPNSMTPDYFHSLSVPSNMNVSIPCNVMGVQDDKIQGNNAYAGLFSDKYGPKEYIYTELNQNLLPNTTYKLSFDLSLAEKYSTYYSFINAYLSPDTSFICNTNYCLNTNSNGLILQNTSFCNDTNNWVTIDITFTTPSTATGVNAYKYLVLGNIDNPNTFILNSNSYTGGISCFPNPSLSSMLIRTYYYIDNVSLTQVLQPATVSPQTTCSGSKATLTAVAPSGAVVNWYNQSIGGTPLATGNTFTTPVLNNYTATPTLQTYYVSYTLNNCTSPIVPVTVNINPIPLAPTISGNTVICPNQSVTLTASAQSGTTIQWYTNLNNPPVATGNTFITSGLVNNTNSNLIFTYYAVSIVNGCKSKPSFVDVTVKPKIAAPIASAQSICVGQTATITISSPIGTGIAYSLFDSNGNLLSNSNSNIFNVSPTSTTTYFVNAHSTSITNANCTSNLAPVIVSVNPLPLAPIRPQANQNFYVCYGESIIINITPSQTGMSYSWHNANGNLIANGMSLNLINVINNATYYIKITNPITGCSSQFPVNVIPQLLQSAITNPLNASLLCNNQSINLIGTAPPATWTNVTYNWFVITNLNPNPVQLGNGQNIWVSPPIGATDATYLLEISGFYGKNCTRRLSSSVKFKDCYKNVDKQSNELTIYPNPADDFVQIELKEKLIDTIEIFNSIGTKIKTLQNINLSELKIDVSEFSSGLYIFKIEDSEKKYTSRQLLIK